MAQKSTRTGARRDERATKLCALQSLREDYELLMFDAIVRKNDILALINAEPSAKAVVPVGTGRRVALAAYYEELASALRVNLNAIAERTLAVQRDLEVRRR